MCKLNYLVSDLLLLQFCLLFTVRVRVLYRRESFCPKLLAVSGCHEILLIGNCDLLYKLQSLHSNYSSTSKYLTSISPPWQYSNDCSVPVKTWFHLHDASVILRISATSESKCNCKKNNTHICVSSAGIHRNSDCESKFLVILVFFYMKPSIIIIRASFIFTKTVDFLCRLYRWK